MARHRSPCDESHRRLPQVGVTWACWRACVMLSRRAYSIYSMPSRRAYSMRRALARWTARGRARRGGRLPLLGLWLCGVGVGACVVPVEIWRVGHQCTETPRMRATTVSIFNNGRPCSSLALSLLHSGGTDAHARHVIQAPMYTLAHTHTGLNFCVCVCERMHAHASSKSQGPCHLPASARAPPLGLGHIN